MKRYTANYSNTVNNFVIQNLNDSSEDSIYLPALCIVKNILHRGCPTKPSKYLQATYGNIHDDLKELKPNPLISKSKPKWERVIRGDIKGNYYPAKLFYDDLLEKYLGEFLFVSNNF